MHSQVQREVCWRTTGVAAIFIAAVLSSLSFQAISAEYKAHFGYKQYHVHYDVNADGTYKELNEIKIKIHTDQAVQMSRQMPFGMPTMPFLAGDRDIEIIAAYTLKKDGKHIAASSVNPSPVGAPAVGAAPMPIFPGKIVAFQNVEIGDELVVSYNAVQKKSAFQDNVVLSHGFPSFVEYDDAIISLSAPVTLNLRIETSGVEKGESSVEGSIRKWVWKYQRKTTAALAPNQPPVFDRIHISSFKDSAAEMEAMKKLAIAFHNLPAAPAASSAETKVAAAPTVSVQLSHSDQKIYDESLNLINQFNGNGNQLETAYDMLVDLAKRNPQSGYPYAALADLKYRLASMGDGSYADAYTIAQRAIKLDPNIADAYVVVTKVYIEQRRLLDAHEAAKKAIALAPNKPEAMFAMARATEKWAEVGIRQGWSAASQAKYGVPEQLYGESERWYRKAIDAYKDNIRKSNMYFSLGNMLSNKIPGNIVGATDAFTKSAELGFNDSPWLLNNVGAFLIDNTDRYDQAIGYIEQALKLMKFDVARINLGLAEYNKWGDSKRNPDKYKNAQRRPLSPEEITAKTGVVPEYAFVINAGERAEPHAALALLENGFIKNVDIVPKGLTRTALIAVANSKSNHLELAKRLIAKRANVNFVDRENQFTPIFWATYWNNLDMVKLLVENGARLNLTNADGAPLVHYAISRSQASGKPAPILLDYLLQQGADPTIPDKYGHTPLSAAVSWNDVAAVHLLVNKYHAEVNTYIPGKRSSLLEGANTKEVTEILLKAGANPWVKGMDNVDLVAKGMSPWNERNPDWPEIKKAKALILEARKHSPKPKDFGQEYQGEYGRAE